MIIETHGLTRKFGDRIAVNDLSLSVEEGEILGFLGPNGAGKTTTIRMLAGLISPTSGYAVIDGIRPDVEPERVHEIIGILTESPGFYDNLSARRNLEYFAGFYPDTDVQARTEKYLKAVGLWERRQDKVGTFSKGMKQRLALARTLLHEPKVLFLDEPTSGLDPEVSREVRELIGTLSQEGYTIILSTHNLSEAEKLCRRIAVIRTDLVALDTPADLRGRFFRREVTIRAESIDDAMTGLIRGAAFVKGLQRDRNTLTIELADPDKNRPELIRMIVEAGGRILEVTEQKHTLEDVYLTLLNENGKSS